MFGYLGRFRAAFLSPAPMFFSYVISNINSKKLQISQYTAPLQTITLNSLNFPKMKMIILFFWKNWCRQAAFYHFFFSYFFLIDLYNYFSKGNRRLIIWTQWAKKSPPPRDLKIQDYQILRNRSCHPSFESKDKVFIIGKNNVLLMR